MNILFIVSIKIIFSVLFCIDNKEKAFSEFISSSLNISLSIISSFLKK